MKTLLLFLFIPFLAFAQVNPPSAARKNTITTAWTTISKTSGNIFGGYIIHDGTSSADTLIIATVGSAASAASTDTCLVGCREYLSIGEAWVAPPGTSTKYIYIRSKTGSIAIRYRIW